MGLEHQEATGQGQVAGEPRPLGAGGLLHHLDEHLLTGLEQLGDTSATFSQAQGTEVGDVNKTIFLTFANVDEGGVDAGEHIFDGAEVYVADLVAALGHHQLIDTLVGEHCGNAQLLGDDDLLGHGESLFGSVSPAWEAGRIAAGSFAATGPIGGVARFVGSPMDGKTDEWGARWTGKTAAAHPARTGEDGCGDRPTVDPLGGSGPSGSDACDQRLGGAGITRTRVNAGRTERRVGGKKSASGEELLKSNLLRKASGR